MASEERGDAEGLAEAIAALNAERKQLSEMKANARKCFEENFKKEVAMGKYYEVISRFSLD